MFRPAGAQPASCSVGTRVFLGVKRADMKLTTYLHLVSRLSMSGAIPVLPLICLHGVDRENFTINCLSQLDQLVVIYRVMFHHNVCRCHWQIQTFQFICKHNLVNRHWMLAVSLLTFIVKRRSLCQQPLLCVKECNWMCLVEVICII